LQFLLEPYEFLTQIEGYYGVTHFEVHGLAIQAPSAIMFHTNLKKVHGHDMDRFIKECACLFWNR